MAAFLAPPCAWYSNHRHTVHSVKRPSLSFSCEPGGSDEDREGNNGGGEVPAPAAPRTDSKKLASLDAKLDALSSEVAELKALLKASLSHGFADK